MACLVCYEILRYRDPREVLIRKLRREKSPASIISALRKLGDKFGDSELPTEVLNLFNHENPVVRRAAAKSAARFEGYAAIFSLVDLSDDKEPGVRLAALEALAELLNTYPNRNIIKVKQGIFETRALRDPNRDVRIAAYRALGTLGSRSAILVLKKALTQWSAEEEQTEITNAICAIESRPFGSSLGEINELAEVKKAIEDILEALKIQVPENSKKDADGIIAKFKEQEEGRKLDTPAKLSAWLEENMESVDSLIRQLEGAVRKTVRQNVEGICEDLKEMTSQGSLPAGKASSLGQVEALAELVKTNAETGFTVTEYMSLRRQTRSVCDIELTTLVKAGFLVLQGRGCYLFTMAGLKRFDTGRSLQTPPAGAALGEGKVANGKAPRVTGYVVGNEARFEIRGFGVILAITNYGKETRPLREVLADAINKFIKKHSLEGFEAGAVNDKDSRNCIKIAGPFSRVKTRIAAVDEKGAEALAADLADMIASLPKPEAKAKPGAQAKTVANGAMGMVIRINGHNVKLPPTLKGQRKLTFGQILDAFKIEDSAVRNAFLTQEKRRQPIPSSRLDRPIDPNNWDFLNIELESDLGSSRYTTSAGKSLGMSRDEMIGYAVKLLKLTNLEITKHMSHITPSVKTEAIDAIFAKEQLNDTEKQVDILNRALEIIREKEERTPELPALKDAVNERIAQEIADHSEISVYQIRAHRKALVPCLDEAEFSEIKQFFEANGVKEDKDQLLVVDRALQLARESESEVKYPHQPLPQEGFENAAVELAKKHSNSFVTIRKIRNYVAPEQQSKVLSEYFSGVGLGEEKNPAVAETQLRILRLTLDIKRGVPMRGVDRHIIMGQQNIEGSLDVPHYPILRTLRWNNLDGDIKTMSRQEKDECLKHAVNWLLEAKRDGKKISVTLLAAGDAARMQKEASKWPGELAEAQKDDPKRFYDPEGKEKTLPPGKKLPLPETLPKAKALCPIAKLSRGEGEDSDRWYDFLECHLVSVKRMNDFLEKLGLGRPFIARVMDNEKYHSQFVAEIERDREEKLNLPDPEKGDEIFFFQQPLGRGVVASVRDVEENKDNNKFSSPLDYERALEYSRKHQGEVLDKLSGVPEGHGEYWFSQLIPLEEHGGKTIFELMRERGIVFDFVRNVDNMASLDENWLILFGFMLKKQYAAMFEASLRPKTEAGKGGAFVITPDFKKKQMEDGVITASEKASKSTDRPFDRNTDEKEHNPDGTNPSPVNDAALYTEMERVFKGTFGEELDGALKITDPVLRAEKLAEVRQAGRKEFGLVPVFKVVKGPEGFEIGRTVFETYAWDIQNGVQGEIVIVGVPSTVDLEEPLEKAGILETVDKSQVKVLDGVEQVRFDPLKRLEDYRSPILQGTREMLADLMVNGPLLVPRTRRLITTIVLSGNAQAFVENAIRSGKVGDISSAAKAPRPMSPSSAEILRRGQEQQRKMAQRKDDDKGPNPTGTGRSLGALEVIMLISVVGAAAATAAYLCRKQKTSDVQIAVRKVLPKEDYLYVMCNRNLPSGERVSAVQGLSMHFGKTEFVPEILKVLEDSSEDDKVRIAAGGAMYQWNDSSVASIVPSLREFLHESVTVKKGTAEGTAKEYLLSSIATSALRALGNVTRKFCGREEAKANQDVFVSWLKSRINSADVKDVVETALISDPTDRSVLQQVGSYLSPRSVDLFNAYLEIEQAIKEKTSGEAQALSLKKLRGIWFPITRAPREVADKVISRLKSLPYSEAEKTPEAIDSLTKQAAGSWVKTATVGQILGELGISRKQGHKDPFSAGEKDKPAGGGKSL
ncbi:MAG: HEAT repeat domain-containing protein, partial [Candidatus Omnitrophica bacterium]|nr:HEAT repeat domain-containing protein [Candidatus Omnitrophota bacterium]